MLLRALLEERSGFPQPCVDEGLIRTKRSNMGSVQMSPRVWSQ
jgi:hypothetical protein